MSDVGIGNSAGGPVFKSATIALMILVGVVGFFGALTLDAYAPDLEGNGGSGAHALSNSAIGYSGLVRLASNTGRSPQIVRDEQVWQGEDLVVVTPESAAVNLNKIIAARGTEQPTLYVLPKWDAGPDGDHKGWVRISGLLPVSEPEGVLAPGLVFDIKRHLDKTPALQNVSPDMPASIRFVTPAKLQVIVRPSKQRDDDTEPPSVVKVQSPPPIIAAEPKQPVVGVDPPPSDEDQAEDQDQDQDEEQDQAEDQDQAGFLDDTFADIKPVITDGSGGIVLGEIDNMFILSDPDLLNNAAMKHPENAAAALALLDWMNWKDSNKIGFDVVLNGLGRAKSLLRLALDPPILAMTLTLVAMIVLIGIRAAGRFGAPQPRTRAIAFGKTALVDNGALLVRKAGKARRMGGRYVAVIRDQAVQRFGVSARLSQAEVDRYLDGLGAGAGFTTLAEAAEAAKSDSEMVAAARALHTWKQEIIGDD